jgi:hypothetical protein
MIAKGDLFVTPGGSIRTHPLPPDGFNPRAASPLELRRYGLPQRPDHPELGARWDEVFSRKLTYITPTFRPMQELLPGIERRGRPRQDVVTVTHPFWSGGVVHATGSEAFTWVVGQWNVPDPHWFEARRPCILNSHNDRLRNYWSVHLLCERPRAKRRSAAARTRNEGFAGRDRAGFEGRGRKTTLRKRAVTPSSSCCSETNSTPKRTSTSGDATEFGFHHRSILERMA